MTRLEIAAVLDKVKFNDGVCDWSFEVSEHSFVILINAVFYRMDVDAPGHQFVKQKGRKFHVSSFAVESEIVQTAFLAIMTALEHEARESFMYDGKRVFGPHIDIKAHQEIADILAKRP